MIERSWYLTVDPVKGLCYAGVPVSGVHEAAWHNFSVEHTLVFTLA